MDVYVTDIHRCTASAISHASIVKGSLQQPDIAVYAEANAPIDLIFGVKVLEEFDQ